MTPYADLLRDVAQTYGLPVDLLTGQMMRESSGDPWAFRYEHDFWLRYIKGNVDAKGARYGPLAACSYGLLQIMLETALEIGFTGPPEQLFVDRIGLAFGAKKMAALVSWAGGTVSDYPRALAAYNGGTGRAVGPPFPNQAYVDGVYKLAGRHI